MPSKLLNAETAGRELGFVIKEQTGKARPDLDAITQAMNRVVMAPSSTPADALALATLVARFTQGMADQAVPLHEAPDDLMVHTTAELAQRVVAILEANIGRSAEIIGQHVTIN